MRKFKYNHPAKCGYSLDMLYGYDELKKELSDEQIEIMFIEIIEEVDKTTVNIKVKK